VDNLFSGMWGGDLCGRGCLGVRRRAHQRVKWCVGGGLGGHQWQATTSQACGGVSR
jgi:hypothetical protein